MKKIIAIIFAVLTAIGLFAFSACNMGGSGNVNDGTGNGNNGGTQKTEVKGSLDGNFTEVAPENYDEILERFDGAIPAADDAETAGGNARSAAEITLSIGDKEIVLTSDSALDLILDLNKIDQEGLEFISGAAVKNETGIKVDDGFSSEAWGIVGPIMFGEEYPTLAELLEQEDFQTIARAITALDGADANAKFNGYVKDSKVYTDVKVTGVPEGIREIVSDKFGVDFIALANGIKYSFTEEELMTLIGNLLGSMMGFGGSENSNYSVKTFGNDNPYALDLSDVDFDYLCELLKLKLYSEDNNGAIKVKLATTTDTKMAVETLLKARFTDEIAEIVNELTVSKLDMEIYLALDENNVLTAVAGKVDAEISATVNEKEVNLSINGALDCSFTVPESIEYPSFSDYESLGAEQPNAA